MTTDTSVAHGGERENHGSRTYFPRFRKIFTSSGSDRTGKGGGRIRRAIRDALDGLPLEKFRRICGFFDAVVPAALKEKNPSGAYINHVVQNFQELRGKIERKLTEKDRVYQADDLGHDAHNLHLLLGELLPATILDNVLPSFRDEYRVRVSPETHAGYLSSPGYKALERCDRKMSEDSRLQLLRADYIYLINEIRRLTLLEYHIEEARSFLIRKLRWTLFKLMIAPLAIGVLFLICHAVVEYNQPPGNSLATTSNEANFFQNWTNFLLKPFLFVNGKPTTFYNALVMATLLGLAAMVGAIGSFISALLRIEAVPESTEIGRSIVALRSSESIRLAPVTGFVFAIVLSLIFGGGLVNGLLFPTLPKNGGPWPFLLFVPDELAKWLTWSFIAGFCERLMPDMIDRLVARADKNLQTSAPAVVRGGANAAGPNGAGPSGIGGGGGKPRKPRRRPRHAAAA